MNNLSYRMISSTEPVATYIAKVLTKHLEQGQRVLWLLSGGSAIDVAVRVSKQLKGIDLQHLTVTLADERFGPVGHADSNWLQLQNAGFLLPGAQVIPVLRGLELAPTAAAFGAVLERVFRNADYRLALLGIGPDGHTAGILPGSVAVTATGMATSYVTEQFTRVTTTMGAIGQLDEAVVYAMGEAKRPALEALQQERPLAEQPAQVLKTVPKITIFNDQLGE